MNKTHSLNVLPPLAFALFAVIMIYGSLTMSPSFSGSNEHRFVPLSVSIFVLILSFWLILQRFIAPSDTQEDESAIEVRPFALLVLPMIGLIAVYAQGQVLFGYLSATFVTGVLIFRLFANGWLASILHSLIGTTVLYLLFFKLLNLYNPPGRWFDLALPF